MSSNDSTSNEGKSLVLVRMNEDASDSRMSRLWHCSLPGRWVTKMRARFGVQDVGDCQTPEP